MKVISKLIIVAIFCLYALPGAANIQSEMDNFFGKFGGGANYNSGGAFKTQQGGFYTGGSLYARMPTKNYTPFNLQTPSFRAGCGGIDMFAGAFSYINSDQLVQAGKNIMGAATGYAFNLALQTITPTLYNTMQKLNDIARDINNLNINSCEAGAQVVGGFWPKSDASSKLLCQSMGTSSNKFGDYAKARQGCGAEGQRTETNNSKTDEFKQQLGDEFNLVWFALTKASNTALDHETAELFMTITGTMIHKIEGEGEHSTIKPIFYASKATDENFLDMFLTGQHHSINAAKYYRCRDRDKCLDVGEQNFTFNAAQALIPKIEKHLLSIANKMRHNSGKLSAAESSLIEMTNIPILKIITVQNAFTSGQAALNIYDYSGIIAYDALLSQLEKIIDLVDNDLKNLEKIQLDGNVIDSFKNNLYRTRSLINDKRMNGYSRMNNILTAIEHSGQMEDRLQWQFDNYNHSKR
ncbi:MAG: conjugal transfer protein TraH [Pseudomonadota bacterium]